MINQHQSTVLVESADIQISKCACCGRYSFNYRNIFMNFSAREFKAFQKVLLALNNSHFDTPHPEGKKAVIGAVKSKYNMGFTKKETQQILIKMEQALIMDAVHSLINGAQSRL